MIRKRSKGIKYILGFSMAMLCLNCSAVFADVDVGNWTDMKSELESGNSVNINSDINVGDFFINLGSDKTVTVNANLHDFNIGENYRIFNNLGNLTINNANFNNGISSAVGMIYNEGQLTINGGMFNYNLAWDGGSLYLVNLSSTAVEDTVFKKNAATGYGGAIYNAGDLTLSNVTIGGDSSEDANYAQKGAGVYNSNKITINEGSFKNNLATNAGALYLTNSATAQINGTIFDSNTAYIEANPSSANGAAIYSEGNLNIAGGSYINNNAWDGGALYLKSTSTSIIENAIFKKNTATGYGGAIYNAGDLTLSNVTIGGNNSEEANTAIQGAGVYNSNKITINGGSFKNNLATNAGALYLTSSATAQINGTIFDSNTAYLEANPSSANGAAIYSEGNLNIAGGSYINNNAWDGGALYLKSNSTSIIENAIFKKNTATGYGGAIYNAGDLTLTDSIFGGSLLTDSNFADHGGAIYNNSSLNINGGSFKNSSATNGGALYLNSSSIAEIEGTVFSANKSTSQGGAIYNNGTLTLTDVNFGEKTGSGTTEDPYVYSDGNTATISSSYQGGGAIFNNSSTLNIYGNSNFYGNSVISASDYGSAGGGAIFNNAGDLNIISDKDGISFVNNAALSGGAIYNSGNVTLENVTFGIKTGAGSDEDPFVYANGNIANTKGGYQGGGAIFNSTGTINLKGDINFYGNTTTATDNNIVSIGGGAIYNNYGTIITSEANNIVFEANSATSGGAIYNSGNATLTNAVFGSRTGTGTTEDPYIYTNGNSATAKGSYQGGGAIYTLGTIVINGNSSFYGNKAETTEVNSSNGGGAIYSNSANVTINSDIADIILAGNTAYKGGAIYNNGGTVNLLATSADIIFSENTASYLGGAFYNSGTINMTASGADILFDNNYAINNGGDIYNEYGTVNLRAAQDNKIVFDDTIYSYSSWASININQIKDDTDYLGAIEFNNEVSGIYDPTINLYNGILKLGHTMQSDGKTLRSIGSISSNKLALFGGTIDMMDGQTGNFIDVPLLSIAKDTTINLKFDVDLSTAISDYIKSNSAISNTGTGTVNGVFNIADINILSDATSDNTSITLFSGSYTPSLGQITGTTIDTTLYRYIVSQDSTNLGNLIFNKSNLYDDFYTAIKSDTDYENFVFNSDINLEKDINEMLGAVDKTVEVNGNGKSIDGNGYKGVIIGNSQTLTLNNIGSESAVESGYKNFNSINGGAINNSGTLNINNSILKDNSASEKGGAIYNTGETNIVSSIMKTNESAGNGGAIYNALNATLNISGETSFLDNTAQGLGGAIYNEGALNLIADNANILFSGNKDTATNSNAIYMNGGELNMNASESQSIIFNDSIKSFDNTSEININAGSENNSGTIVLNADMSNYTGDVNIYSGILKLGNEGVFFGNSLNQIDLLMSENATIDLQNGKIDSIGLNSFTGGGKFNIDADLSLGLADNILALNANQTENIIISGISILSDKTSNQSLKMFSDNITINDFSIKATTSNEKYLITKDPSNEGYIYITYKGKVGDALVELLEDDGNRSYTLTNSIYTASLDLPYLNASDDESVNNLEIFGQNKTFSGDNKFSMFKVDATNALYGQNIPRELTIHNATISNARAEEGSALLINGQGANVTLNNVTIRDNISTGNGGAVNISAGGSLTISDGGGFYNNTSISGQGGAVYLEGNSTNTATLTLISNTKNTVFGNNIAGSEQNSIYMAGNSTVNINNSSTNKLILPTAILTSGDNNTLNINKPIDSLVTTGNFDIDTDYSGFKGNNNSVNLYNGTLTLKDGGIFFGNTSNTSDYINFAMMNDSTLNLQNTAIDTIYLNSLNIIGNAAKAKLDIDLTNHAADTIISSSVIGTPILNIDSFNIISNAVTDSLFGITSPNITINYTGTESYYTNDYYYNISKDSTSNKIRFVSTFIGGDGLTRSLSNIGTRTYSMVLDSKGLPETYTATSNLPSLNAEYAEGRTNKVTVYGNSGNISGNNLYSLFKIDSSDNVQRTLDIQNITLRNALSDKGSALSIIGSKSTVNSSNIQFKNNKSTNKGGAIYLKDGAQLNISGNSKFENNTAQGQGGAIYASGTSSDVSKINLTAAASNTIEFSGNKQNSTENNAIFLDGHSELNLKSLAATSKIVFNDKIKSSGEGNVININKADASSYTGTTAFNADMSGYEGELNLFNGTLQLSKNNMQFNTSNFNIYQNATLDMRNAAIDNLNISNLNLIDSKAYLNVDIEGLTQKADTIKSNGASGDLTINRFSILSDLTATVSNPIEISKTEGLNIIADTTTQYLGPIYKYNISSAGDNRSIILTKTSINPVVLSSPVTSTVGTYSNVLNSYEQAFTNSDTFMMQPYIQRLAYRMKDRVAINEVKGYEPIYSEQVAGVWFRPYTTFENVGLKNGPSVSNISYGSFVGFDLPLEEKKFGFQKVIGAYAGYNGVHQKYDDVSVYQNGGLIGLTQSFYKDNFFTSLTANVSASAADSSSSHARSEFTTMTAGLASKTGYNLEFLESKFIIQPSIMLAYSFIKTFDYKNSNSTQFTSNPLSVFQINPGLKFISNFKNGYQPYLGINMVWNITGGGDFKANDTYLPTVSVKPYVEYGLGVQKRWGEKLTGYAQSMVRNGGRNGVSLQFGLKWAL